ncbi:MAG TPA: type IV secretion system protein [Steroidobacteraceae bacterium]|nr:type IV secretion system protein [Steroidobacteraceae bacterium]
MSVDRALQGYLEEAASWDADRMAQATRTAAVAWRVAAAGWMCAVASAVALALLMPLKRIEPYLIRVDSSTGVVDVVPIYTGHAPLGEAVTRYFLSRYITVCEQFDYATAESDYEQCGAFNSARLNQAMYAQWNRANPNSPLNLHKDGSTETVRIESVSLFKRATGASDLAQVRYARIERLGEGAPGRITRWIASIEYRFDKPPDDAQTRAWNPLGFEALDLGIEPEVLATARDSSGH